MATSPARRAGSSASSPGRPVERLRSFFAEKIWTVPAPGGRRGRALGYHISRVAYASARGVFVNRLTVRAAALTYYTVLSLVPFLAFAFAILKGFGAYRTFVEVLLRPYVHQTFGDNPALLGSMERVLQFVDRTDVSALGALGLVALVYTCLSLLGSIEEAFNETWGARTKRTLLRQVTDYVTLLVITPLLTMTAATSAAAAQSSRVVLFLRNALDLGVVIDFVLRFSSLAIVAVAFFALYLILPNVRVRATSAALGAAVAAVAWQGALVVYVRLQVGVSNFNALYSVLSAIPIFLVWTYASWIVVLVGAQVAASHQNEWTIRQRIRATQADEELKEMVAVLVAARVARAFVTGVPWRSRTDLAGLGAVSPLTIEEILDALVRGRILARAVASGEVTYLPARDLDTVRVEDVREALRKDGQAEAVRAEVERQMEPGLRRLLHAADEEGRAAGWNVTLRQLSALATGADDDSARSIPPPPRGAPAERSGPPADPK